jgi:hypothetical protein
MPNIIFSVMQKPFIKCVIRQRVGRFLHNRKKLIRRFQKKKQQHKWHKFDFRTILAAKNISSFSIVF